MRKAAILFVLLTALVSLTVSPVLSCDRSDGVVAETDIVIRDESPSTISLSAGGSIKIDITAYNQSAYIDNSIENLVRIKITATVTDPSGTVNTDITTKVATADGKSYADINNQSYANYTMTVSADRFTKHQDYTLTYTYTATDTAGTQITTGTVTHTLSVDSVYSTVDSYNKFLGMYDNPFDGILGTPVVTMLISFLIWLLIGAVMILLLVPVFIRLICRSDDPDRPILRKTLIRLFQVINVTFAVVNSSYILGVSESIESTIGSIAGVIYIAVGAGIAWKIYRTLLDRLSDYLRGVDLIPGGDVQDFESYKPLLIYLGEITIGIVVTVALLGKFGFDITAIITSAGLVTLGITFGAQQILAQFFSGLVLLSTRPFKKGDLIQVGSGSIVYKVRKVNIMNTELENWDNSDITIVPNNTVTSSMVKNITRDTLRTKVHLFIEVSYNTDIAKARQTLLDCAYAHPRVIKDGSVSKPSTRLTDFKDSNIELRLTVWVDDYNDSGSIGGDLRVAIYEKFKEVGIDIDYTQIVLHTDDEVDDSIDSSAAAKSSRPSTSQ